MSNVVECTRSYIRENLNFTSWNEFFTIAGNTPYVHEERGGLWLTSPDNRVAFLSDIGFTEHGFSYKINFLAEDMTEDKFLAEYTLEPVYHQVIRGGKVVRSEIQALELVKTGH